MDQRLSSRLTKLARQIKILEEAERASMLIDTHEKILFSELFLTFKGSIAEREALVYATPQWQEFVKGQVNANVEYNKAKRYYELLDKAFQAEYLSFKIDSQAISRGVE